MKRPVGEGDSRWHVHRGMFTYAATRVGAYLGEHRAPCVGVYVTRYAAASAAAYVGQDRRLHVWREYRYTRLHVWPRILAKIRAGTE